MAEDNTPEPEQSDSDSYVAAMVQARIKLWEAEQAWQKAFELAPLGGERIFAATVYERIKCATRRF